MDTDDLLIAGIKHGDYVCFSRLFFCYYQRLCSYVAEITKDNNASEDLVQELFIKLWINHKNIEIHKNVSSYLFKSSKNAALNYIRSETSRKNAVENIPLITFQLPDDTIEYDEFLSVLDKCINQLPARSKEVFLLNRINGIKHNEISEKLNISVKTIKNQIWKSLQFLKSCLERKAEF